MAYYTSKNDNLNYDSSNVEKWLTDAGKFFSDVQSKSGSIDTYGGWESYKSGIDYNKMNTLRRQVIDARLYLSDNKDALGNDNYNALTKQINSYVNAMDYLTDQRSELDNYYSQWKSEADYNSAMKQQAEQQKEYQRLMGIDVEATKQQYQNTQKRLEQLQTELNRANNPQAYPDQRNSAVVMSDIEQVKKLQNQYYKDYTDAQQLQALEQYNNLKNAPDFSRLAQQGLSAKKPEYKDLSNIGFVDSYYSDYDKIVYPFGNSAKLTDDEENIYGYLVATKGEKAANQYLDTLQETINYRRGTDLANSIQGNRFLQLISGVPAGIDQFAGGIQQLFQENRIPTSATQVASAQTRENLSESGPKLFGSSLGQIGYDMVTTTANMAPSILLSGLITAATGGTGAPVASALGASLMGASAGGNAYNQALSEGFSPDSARAYGMLTGASEAALQYLLGGISKLGGRLTSKTVQAAINKIDNTILRFAAEQGIHMLGEGTEEYLQEILTPVFRNIVFDENNQIKPFSQEALYAGLLGALSAGIMEGPSILANTISNRQATGNAGHNEIQNTNTPSETMPVIRSGINGEIIDNAGENQYNNIRGEQRETEVYQTEYPTTQNQAGGYAGVSGQAVTGDYSGTAQRQYDRRADYRGVGLDVAQSLQNQGITPDIANSPEGRVLYDITNVKELPGNHEYRGGTVPLYNTVSSGELPLGNTIDRISADNALLDTNIPQDTTGVNNSILENSENMPIRIPQADLDIMQSIAESHKIRFEIADLGQGINGNYKDGVIYVSPYTQQPVLEIFKHELTHRLEQTGRYKDLYQIAKEYYNNAAEDTDFAAEARRKQDLYQRRGKDISFREAEREVVADFVGQHLFTDDAEIRHLANTRPTLARSIVNWIREIIAIFKGDTQSELLLRAERKYLSALRQADNRDGIKNNQQDPRYSINPDFEAQYDRWDKKNNRGYFKVGTTSEALKSIGIEPSEIYWDKAKIIKIQKDHPDMTDSVIKQVPQLLENPMIVMQSQTVVNRIVALGEVYADGKPVLCALELRPKNNKNEIGNFVKIASAYSKNSLQNLVNTSDILYVNPNKNKTDSWLKAIRLQLPSGLTNYGSIHNVTYVNKNVNGNVTFGAVPKKTAMRAAFEKAGYNTSISESGENSTGNTKYSLNDSKSIPLEQRVSGDELLDALDLIDTLQSVGAKVDKNGYITVYHRTNEQNKEKILSSARMTAKEDGIFFSTKKDGQNVGYGSEIIEFKIPAEKLMLDDIFDNEAHLRLPLKRAGEIIDISQYLNDNTGNDAGESKYSLADDYDFLVNQYGAIEPGENPVRDVSVPRQTADDNRVGRTVRTAMEAQGTPDALVDRLKEDVVNGIHSYKVVTDKAATDSANNRLDQWGFEKSYQYWKTLIEGNKKVTKYDMALAQQMYIEAANNGDFDLAQQILADVAVEATRAGQTGQAIHLLKSLTPQGRLYKIDRLVYKIQQDIDRRTKGKGKTIKVKDELKNRMLRARSIEEMDAIEQRIHQDIAEQMPDPTLLDKWNEWRYLAMLGNPRTHIRNILGNVLFVPAIQTKNALGTLIEKALPQEQRTKAILTPKDRAAIDYAKADFDQIADEVMGGSKYGQGSNSLNTDRRVFKNRLLERARKSNSNALEKEDRIFTKRAYASSLAQIIKARGWDVNNITDEQLSEARNHAIREAQKATYRDESKVADFLNKISELNKPLNIIVEGVLPFKKTPINILKRGVEYSPLGLVNGIKEIVYDVRKGNKTAAEAIDHICVGLTGTGMLAMGMFLSAMGWLRSTSDDDEEKSLDTLSGKQEYALQIGDYSYTIDWIAPLSLPLFVGAEIQNYIERGDADAVKSFGRVLDALTGMSDPMFNLSMLQGINSTMETVRYSDNPVIDVVANTAAGYAGQAVPTLLGQISRTIDPTRRNTWYTPEDSNAGKLINKTVKKIQAKTPLSRLLEPYVDKWGQQESEENLFVRALENFFSPGYVSKDTDDPVTKDLVEIYSRSGEDGVIPKSAPNSLKLDGETYRLTEKEYTAYQKTLGSLSHDLIEQYINSPVYHSMTDSERAETISDLYSYANETAKNEFYSGRNIPYTIDDMPKTKKFNEVEQEGVNLFEYLYAKIKIKDIEGDKRANGDTISGSVKRNKINYMVNQLGFSRQEANKIYELT